MKQESEGAAISLSYLRALSSSSCWLEVAHLSGLSHSVFKSLASPTKPTIDCPGFLQKELVLKKKKKF